MATIEDIFEKGFNNYIKSCMASGFTIDSKKDAIHGKPK